MDWGWGREGDSKDDGYNLPFGLCSIFLWMCELFLFLLTLGLFVSRKSLYNDARMSPQFEAKKSFHQMVLILCIIRMTQFTFVSISAFQIWKSPASDLIFLLAGDWGGSYFMLVYFSLLVFWYSFLKVIENRDSPADYLKKSTQSVLVGAQILCLFVCTLDLGGTLFLYFVGKYNQLIRTHLLATLIYDLFLVFEAAIFLFLGISVHRTLTKIGSYRILTSRAVQVIATAILVTIVFMVRASLSLTALVDSLNELNNDIQINPEDSMAYLFGNWAYFLAYYLIGEIIPVLVMVVFQSRLPKTEVQSDLIDDTTNSTTPLNSSANSYSFPQQFSFRSTSPAPSTSPSPPSTSPPGSIFPSPYPSPYSPAYASSTIPLSPLPNEGV